MKQSSIVLPNQDNQGFPLLDVHSALKAQLCATFGGFTATRADGGWQDEKSGAIYCEPVTKYDIANTDAKPDRLESIAVFYGHMAGQLAVYTVHNGAPRILDVTPRGDLLVYMSAEKNSDYVPNILD